MSWRRFLVLLRGLSPQSATVTSLRSRQETGPKGERVNVVSGHKAAQAAFEAIFRP